MKLTSHFYWHKLINQSVLKLILLKILEKESLWGYLLPQKVKEFCQTPYSPSQGRIYLILGNLEKEGYLKSSWQEITPLKGRKLYKITKEGKLILKIAKKEWKNILPIISKL